MKLKTRKSCWSNRVCRMGRAYALVLLAAIALCSLSGPVQAEGTAGAGPVCIVVPHFKDEYWLSVGFGLREEARRLGVDLLIHESGGYHALGRQIALLENCRTSGAGSVLLGAVSADDPALLAAVSRVARDIPVLALVNELRAQDLAGAIGVDWREMGRAVGDYLTTRHPAGSAPVKIGFVTGPEDSGWSPLLESGLRAGLRGSAVEIAITRHADSGLREQLREVEHVVKQEPQIDYLVGTAPAIEGAMGLAARFEGTFPQLIATYVSHSVRRGLRNGQVVAVPFDDPVEQGRMGVRMALEAMQGRHADGIQGPAIRLIDAKDAMDGPITLSPADLQLAIE